MVLLMALTILPAQRRSARGDRKVTEPITMSSVSLDDLCINTIRALTMDAV